MANVRYLVLLQIHRFIYSIHYFSIYSVVLCYVWTLPFYPISSTGIIFNGDVNYLIKMTPREIYCIMTNSIIFHYIILHYSKQCYTILLTKTLLHYKLVEERL